MVAPEAIVKERSVIGGQELRCHYIGHVRSTEFPLLIINISVYLVGVFPKLYFSY